MANYTSETYLSQLSLTTSGNLSKNNSEENLLSPAYSFQVSSHQDILDDINNRLNLAVEESLGRTEAPSTPATSSRSKHFNSDTEIIPIRGNETFLNYLPEHSPEENLPLLGGIYSPSSYCSWLKCCFE